MNIKGKIKRAKAISPIIATIILIVLTVVAGGFVYLYAMGMLHTGAANQNVNVQSDSLIIPTGATTATWSMTLQNAGTIGVKTVVLTLTNTTGTIGTLTFKSISPGATSSTSATKLLDIVAGTSYTVYGTVYYTNGANSSIITSVTASVF